MSVGLYEIGHGFDPSPPLLNNVKKLQYWYGQASLTVADANAEERFDDILVEILKLLW